MGHRRFVYSAAMDGKRKGTGSGTLDSGMPVPCLIIGIVLLLFLPVPASAEGSVLLSSGDFILTGDHPVTVTASVSGFSPGETIGIKGAFFADGSSNYFGYTQNGTDWIKNSAKNELQRTVAVGTWDGTLSVRADTEDTGFTGDGTYAFRLRYYFGDGKSGWSGNSVRASVTAPSPTPTITVTPSPTPTVKPSRTPTPTPRPVPAADTIPPSDTPETEAPDPVREAPPVPVPSAILGIHTVRVRDAEASEPAAEQPVTGRAAPVRKAAVALSATGAILAIVSAVLAYKRARLP